MDDFFFTAADLKVENIEEMLYYKDVKVSEAMARKASQNFENQKGRKNKAFAIIKSDLEEKERQKKRTHSKKVNYSIFWDIFTKCYFTDL